ncbi:phytoene dehydrogenase [Polyangium sp. 6x1]|uniref:NAD(P)-binding protein n=1 Tax=Polyangium sp. 6x1 TaxID=3042689 RepID=UPI0024827AF7|nr:phytoene dehydrogenase [Polyangium sp. 6x1]MDI1447337.1 phytoene dehydrogenase [Polyangium sp. 6x1]
MTSKHFDVVVLGRSLGALVTAALLARRDFTVLVLGQGGRPASYKLGERTLRRRAFTMLAASSPAWTRVLVELAQSQTWKRRVVAASPMMQVLAPRRRLDIPPDLVLFGREIDREMPEVRRVVDDLYAELARVNGAADEAFERDAVWPPGTFWERRETGRYAAMLPYVRAEPDADLLVELPRGHFFRQVVTSSVSFATDLATLPPPFAVARLHGAWTRGLYTLPGGEDELEQFLVDRIAAHGGRCMLSARARALHLRRGSAAGVIVDGDEGPTGASFVISDLDGEGLAALSGGEGIHKRAQREWPRITSSVGRFVVSLVVRDEGLPAPLGVESFVLPGDRPALRNAARTAPAAGPRSSAPPGALRPVIHLERHVMPGVRGESLLVAEVLLPDRSPIPPVSMREVVLSTLAAELPFLERHLRVVDSVHDGLPVWVYEDGRFRPVDRGSLTGAAAAPEPMVRQLDVDPPGYLGLGGEPIRGPIERTLLVGRSVLPGLGQEGQLLAAWGAARLVTRTDRRKEKMRRDMWSKVEIG